MTYAVHLNQVKIIEWNLSFKAAALLSQMSVLSSWAKPVSKNGEVYYILYRKKILKELPTLGRSVATISKYIKELEDKGLIESINKNIDPAYRLSEKGKEWVSSTNEVKKNENSQKDEEFTFDLKKKSSYDQLSEEYLFYLSVCCKNYAKEVNIPEDEYESFIDYYAARGTLYKNWGKAFKSWCHKYKKDNPKNSKDDYFSGLYP